MTGSLFSFSVLFKKVSNTSKNCIIELGGRYQVEIINNYNCGFIFSFLISRQIASAMSGIRNSSSIVISVFSNQGLSTSELSISSLVSFRRIISKGCSEINIASSSLCLFRLAMFKCPILKASSLGYIPTCVFKL